MADDPADRLPPTDRVPEHAPVGRRARVACEFCECELAPNGDVMKMSDKAKALRDQGDTVERHRATIAQLETDLATARRELAEKTAPAAPSASSGGLTL